jgi:hypothetical protein
MQLVNGGLDRGHVHDYKVPVPLPIDDPTELVRDTQLVADLLCHIAPERLIQLLASFYSPTDDGPVTRMKDPRLVVAKIQQHVPTRVGQEGHYARPFMLSRANCLGILLSQEADTGHRSINVVSHPLQPPASLVLDRPTEPIRHSNVGEQKPGQSAGPKRVLRKCVALSFGRSGLDDRNTTKPR